MSLLDEPSPARIAGLMLAAGSLFVAGLALTRLLYEALFPHFLFFGRPLPVVIIASIGMTAVLYLGHKALVRRAADSRQQTLALAAVLSPLLLNLLYLLEPTVQLAASRFLFGAGLWLTAVFLARLLAPQEHWRWLGILFVWLALLPLYLVTIPSVVGRADTFEFQVVIPQLGIAHPTGYPLYILLGRLFAAIPFGSMAWRINLASAVFATSAVMLLYLAGLRAWKEPVAALLGAVVFGLTPTLFGQAVEAEVYALHALLVASALYLMTVMVDHGSAQGSCASSPWSGLQKASWQFPVLLLALVLGLGLTHHLTTAVLLPAAVLAVWLAYGPCLRTQGWRANLVFISKVGAALIIPLLLYAYLPLRWASLHDEPMGTQRFLEWVLGGRFRDALQLTAWLTDRTRYEIVWRLLLAEWGWFNLGLSLLGLLYLMMRQWRLALVFLVVLGGFVFYVLNYHVPDLAVFLIPGHIIVALFWGAGLTAVISLSSTLLERRGWMACRFAVGAVLTLLLVIPQLVRTANNVPDTRYAEQTALQAWGEGVLALPLAEKATILADSEKIAPLYYLQQNEGLREDLEIMVLPDEAAYRAELDARLAAGETVYLARFLPGLEGIYHLRSLGPLIEVSNSPLVDLPGSATGTNIAFGDLALVGYVVEEPAAMDKQTTAVTLFWKAEGATAEPLFVYTRWSGGEYSGAPDVAGGAHPAANYYPTVAFRPGEIVPDYHLIPRPLIPQSQALDLQVALGPQFARPELLDWQRVTTVDIQPAYLLETGTRFRAENGRVLLSGADFPLEIRPGTPLPIVIAGYGEQSGLLDFELLPLGQEGERKPASDRQMPEEMELHPLTYATEVDTNLPNGKYQLLSSDRQYASTCGWMAAPSTGCVLGVVTISGVPLAAEAANFADKIALLSADVPAAPLQAGSVLPVHLRWQALGEMGEDYTVFIQLLDEQERIVAQVDTWPVQGTYPTSQWSPGEVIEDRYEIVLPAELPPGSYRLQAGLYLLATLRRLSVVDSQGNAIEDKVTITSLTAE